MTFSMDLKEARFTLTDLVKIVGYTISITIFAITLHSGLSSVKEAVSEIRTTQIENTKKNDLRWEAIGVEINALKLNQSLMEQRIKALEIRK